MKMYANQQAMVEAVRPASLDYFQADRTRLSDTEVSCFWFSCERDQVLKCGLSCS